MTAPLVHPAAHFGRLTGLALRSFAWELASGCQGGGPSSDQHHLGDGVMLERFELPDSGVLRRPAITALVREIGERLAVPRSSRCPAAT